MTDQDGYDTEMLTHFDGPMRRACSICGRVKGEGHGPDCANTPLDAKPQTPPAVFLCQVCDQTPERGHAPDCPGATQPPKVALALGVITTDMMQEAERGAAQPAETPPLLTPADLDRLTAALVDLVPCRTCRVLEAMGEDGEPLPPCSLCDTQREAAGQLRAQAAALRTAEGRGLECPTCGYGTNRMDQETCDNDGTRLVFVTWKDRAMSAVARVPELKARAEQAEREAAAMREKLDAIREQADQAGFADEESRADPAKVIRTLRNVVDENWASIAALKKTVAASERLRSLDAATHLDELAALRQAVKTLEYENRVLKGLHVLLDMNEAGAPLQEPTAPALHEYDHDEWFDVARALQPGLSDEEYEAMWARFIAAKRVHEVQ